MIGALVRWPGFSFLGSRPHRSRLVAISGKRRGLELNGEQCVKGHNVSSGMREIIRKNYTPQRQPLYLTYMSHKNVMNIS
jgi:hypothetical protein